MRRSGSRAANISSFQTLWSCENLASSESMPWALRFILSDVVGLDIGQYLRVLECSPLHGGGLHASVSMRDGQHYKEEYSQGGHSSLHGYGLNEAALVELDY
ncbi:hypothetical protein VNO77_37207 [Canavalia gladiata]|uniref:Uncharacterized protein n=1 Tax=Canavalia gladiata TaxID=3824 RepID=A0AAN9KBV7_CANGL